jgi:hypothetical protein
MTAARLLQLQLEQAVLLALAFFVLRGAWSLGTRGSNAPERWRRIAAGVIASALVLPFLVRGVPRTLGAHEPSRATTPVALVPVARAARPAGIERLRGPAYQWTLSRPGQTLAAGLLAVLGGGAAVRLLAESRRRRRLRRSLEALPVVRRIGRVTVSASDVATVPYAAHVAGRAWVVMPSDVLGDGAALRMSIAHELQHHRQGDLQALRAFEILHALFWWHPVMPRWARFVEELQEVSCDAAVLRGGRVERDAYVEMLVDAATRRSIRFVPRGVTAVSGTSPGVLHRRIDMMTQGGRRNSRGRDRMMAVLCLGLLVLGAVGVRGAVVERVLSAPDVAALTHRLAARGVVVPVDAIVVEEVNKWTADPKGRAFLRDARARLEEHRGMVEATLARHQVPSALAAVAIVESGFRSLEPRPGVQGAGVWQFIPATARRFGLAVDDGRDDRMDLDRETDAAARYLGAMHGQLDDWTLALAAYSQGESAVGQAIDAAGTRDPWTLMRQGQIGRYAATVIAAALVLEDPDRLLAEPAE